jgi:hypothetical protein
VPAIVRYIRRAAWASLTVRAIQRVAMFREMSVLRLHIKQRGVWLHILPAARYCATEIPPEEREE